MTSNVGARNISEPKSLGFASERTAADVQKNIRSGVTEELKRMFRPEFLNRVDDIIVFSQLSEDEIAEIARLMLSSLEKRLKANGINASFDDSAVRLLAKEGFDPVYGARPLRRAIQSKVEDLIAEKMLDGEINQGSLITVSADGDGIIIK